MLLLTGSLAAYRIPVDQVMAPEHNLRLQRRWEAQSPAEKESTDISLQSMQTNSEITASAPWIR